MPVRYVWHSRGSCAATDLLYGINISSQLCCNSLQLLYKKKVKNKNKNLVNAQDFHSLNFELKILRIKLKMKAEITLQCTITPYLQLNWMGNLEKDFLCKRFVKRDGPLEMLLLL